MLDLLCIARMLAVRPGACAHELMFSLVSTSCAHSLRDSSDCPLLFAKHEGCLASTDEGFEGTLRPPAQSATCVSDACAADEPGVRQALRAFWKDVVAAQ